MYPREPLNSTDKTTSLRLYYFQSQYLSLGSFDFDHEKSRNRSLSSQTLIDQHFDVYAPVFGSSRMPSRCSPWDQPCPSLLPVVRGTYFN
jgi:hypothetical protein